MQNHHREKTREAQGKRFKCISEQKGEEALTLCVPPDKTQKKAPRVCVWVHTRAHCRGEVHEEVLWLAVLPRHI